MQSTIKRAIVTLLWVACIVGSGPALGYAQVASERLSVQAEAASRDTDVFEQMTAITGAPDGVAHPSARTRDDPF